MCNAGYLVTVDRMKLEKNMLQYISKLLPEFSKSSRFWLLLFRLHLAKINNSTGVIKTKLFSLLCLFLLL